MQPIKQATASTNLPASKENIDQFIIAPVKIYTKLASLSNQISVKKHTLVLDALNCFHRLGEETPQVTQVATEY